MDTMIVGDVAVDTDLNDGEDTSGAMEGDVDTVSFERVVDEGIGDVETAWILGTDAMGIENVIGTQEDDWITGDTNSNVIEGGEGGDTLIGGGGDGEDTLSYESSDDWVRVTLGDDTDAATDSQGSCFRRYGYRLRKHQGFCLR